MNAVYETSTGRLVSVGTVVANPLPAGLSSVALSAPDAQGLRAGLKIWNASTRSVVDVPSWAGETAPEPTVALLAELLVAADVKAGTLTNDEIAKRAPLFPPWKPGIAVKVGEVYRWDGTLVEVIQAHTTQADWTPDKVPALFKIHRTAAVAPWVQPTSTTAYKIGDRVTFEGKTYESKINANVWSPTAYPAGWQLIA